jgi:hypothetical protein
MTLVVHLLGTHAQPNDLSWNSSCLLIVVASADKAQTTQAQVENEKRVNSKHNPVFNDPRATQNAYASCQRPSNQDKVYRYPGNRRQIQC